MLPEKDALDLIEAHQPFGRLDDDSERRAASEIVRLLGGFTLVVESAAVFLGEVAGEITCSAFLERLKKEGLAGLEDAGGQGGLRHGERRLSATLSPTLDRLGPTETHVLTAAALLPADQVALPWIRAVVGEGHPELGRDAEPGYPDPWQSLVRRLLGLRLLKPTADPRVAGMHRLVAEVVRRRGGDAVTALEAALIAHATRRSVISSVEWIHQEAHWELAPLVATAGQWLRSGKREVPAVAGPVANALFRLARFAEAEALYRATLGVHETNLGPEHRDVAADLSNLANVLSGTMRYDEAEHLYRRAIAILEKSPGREHAGIAAAVSNLAHLLHATNRYAEAEPLYRRALAIGEKSSVNAPDLATILNNLAALLAAAHRGAEAEPLYRRAIAIDRANLGPEHPEVARDLNNLALMLVAENRLAEAEPLYRSALAIREKSFGPKHIELAMTLSDLADLLKAMNHLVEAESLYRRALAIVEKGLEPNHPFLAQSLNNLGILLNATKRVADAEPLFRRAVSGLAVFVKMTGLRHSELDAVAKNYVDALEEMGLEPEEIHHRLAELGLMISRP